jgi:hypothetical protein
VTWNSAFKFCETQREKQKEITAEREEERNKEIYRGKDKNRN